MKKIAFLFLFGALLASCGSESNEYNVSGKIDGVTEGEAVLQKIESSGPVAVDSSAIVDGEFSFSGKVEHPELYLVYVNDNQAPVALFLEPGDIAVSGNIEDLQEARVEGSELNEKFEKFDDELPSKERSQQLQEEFVQAREGNDDEKMQELAQEYQGIMESQQQYFHDFIFANTDNAVGAFMALNMANTLEPDEFEELISSFEENISGHPYIQEMKQMQETMQQQQQMPAPQPQQPQQPQEAQPEE